MLGRAAVAGLSVFAVVLTSAAGVPPQASAVSIDIRPAADLSRFNPGNIISDEVFFNASTMGEEAIAAFLRARVPNCQSGYVCLKDFAQNTNSKAADSYCAGYAGAANESAARIIDKVAKSCGINPQALLVTLQKEQGLVTHTWPSEWRYTAAMGQGCPDTAACDARYYGFQNQVYGAARQFKIYAEGRYFTYYAPGKTWNILYHPNRNCGTGAVFISNKATAGLYYYTPYQPNAAALRAGYGEGDSCSSYGNRNFYQYFTDWFGSTTIGTHGAIGNIWAASGGAASWIGGPVAEMVWDESNGGGWYQRFANATIYYAVSGASAVLKSASLINSTYEAQGRVSSRYGWPTTSENCGGSGCSVQFQGGSLVWSNETGAVLPVVGSINSAWLSSGGVNSGLRAPQAPERYVPENGGGWTQAFLGGTIYVKAGGAITSFAASSGLLNRYQSSGGPASALGWPASAETCATGVGCAIAFDNGTLSWDKLTGGIHTLSGLFAQEWWAGGGPANWVGTARSEMAGLDGGWRQEFRNGTYYLKAGGVLIGLKNASALHDTYRGRGAQGGSIGWPVTGETCGSGACMITFEKGNLVWDASTGAIASVSGLFMTGWREAGGPASWMGPPRAEATVVGGGQGSTQDFRNATGYARQGSSPVFHKWDSALAATYRAMGGALSDLGWPTSGESCGSGRCVLAFEHGNLVWTAGTGLISRE